MSKICTFCGHGDIANDYMAHYKGEDGKLCDILKQAIIDCIEEYGITEFYSSGLGYFDNLGAKTVFDLQKLKQYSHIKSVRVLHKVPSKKTEDELEYEKALKDIINYHETMVCENAGKGFAQGWIQNCNRYMVKSSDVVIACINRSAISNSYKIYKYAVNQGKTVINLLEFAE